VGCVPERRGALPYMLVARRSSSAPQWRGRGPSASPAPAIGRSSSAIPLFPRGEGAGEPHGPGGACCVAGVGGRHQPQLPRGLGWVIYVVPVDLLHGARCPGLRARIRRRRMPPMELLCDGRALLGSAGC
jgi:hypothetical protein